MCTFSCNGSNTHQPQNNNDDGLKNPLRGGGSTEVDATPSEDSTPTDWKSAYLNEIERRKEINSTFALIYVDNDNIPELYILGFCEAEGDTVFSFKNGKLIELHLGRMFGGKYIEKSGLIINENGNMGYYYTTVYSLSDSGFTTLFEGTETESYSGEAANPTVTTEYKIDGNTVTQAEYDAAIAELFDLSLAKAFHESGMSYATIKQQLSGSAGSTDEKQTKSTYNRCFLLSGS